MKMGEVKKALGLAESIIKNKRIYYHCGCREAVQLAHLCRTSLKEGIAKREAEKQEEDIE